MGGGAAGSTYPHVGGGTICSHSLPLRATRAYSLRVVRHLQYNARWAAKLEKKKANQQQRAERRRQQEEQSRKRKEEEEARSKVNPFASGASAMNGGGGLGGSLFGGGGAFGSGGNPFSTSAAPAAAPSTNAQPPAQQDATTEEEDDASDGSDSEADSAAEDEARLAEELAMKAALTTASASQSNWVPSLAPHYAPPLYLNTVPESSSSARAGDKASKLTKEAAALKKKALAASADNATDEELKVMEKESYERTMLVGVDEVLEKFMARVGSEGRQVVRYELGGQPLPFNAQGELYDTLWPKAKTAGHGRSYDPSRIPPCEACGSRRTFELQLMPALVHTLRADKIQGAESEKDLATNDDDANVDAESRRRRDLEAALGRRLAPQPDKDGITRSKGDAAAAADGSSTVAAGGKTGLCWSTAMVFVCEKDCCIPRPEEGKDGETWREEWVGTQFED